MMLHYFKTDALLVDNTIKGSFLFYLSFIVSDCNYPVDNPPFFL